MLEFNTDMIPQLIISLDEKKINTYIASYIRDNAVLSYDVIHIIPKTQELGINEIRDISYFVFTKATSKRIIVIHSFETASIEAQNAILKMLEEKTKENTFFLCAKNNRSILSTVQSRVSLVYLDKENAVLEKERIQKINTMFNELQKKESYGFLQNDLTLTKTRDEAIILIDDLILFLRQKLLESKKIDLIPIMNKAFQTKNNILLLNHSHQLALDNLLIFIHKTVTMK